MCLFSFIEFDPVRNPEYTYYKVIVEKESTDDTGATIHIQKCYIDEFEASLTEFDRKNLKRLYALMDRFSSRILLKKDKFRHIEGRKNDRNDIFEFKKDRLRVYVCKDDDKRIIGVLYGGFKQNQDNDTKRIFRIFEKLILPEE